jgi:hypothetical protein
MNQKGSANGPHRTHTSMNCPIIYRVNWYLTSMLILILRLTLGSIFANQAADQALAADASNLTPVELKLRDIESRLQIVETAHANIEAMGSPESRELSQLKLALELPEPLGEGFLGMGPAASRVYNSQKPLAIGAFGEVHYTTKDSNQETSRDGSQHEDSRATDFSRLNFFLGNRFNSTIVFNSSFAFERGGAFDGSQATNATRLEYAYLDFFLSERVGLRVGNILIPVGVTNLSFEPTLFPMTNRPRPEQTIIPTTWNENGAIAFYFLPDTWGQRIELQLGVVNSGDISRALSETWIRKGRQGATFAKAEDAAWVARFDFSSKQAKLGLSLYNGNWNQGNSSLGRANVTLGEVHGALHFGRFRLHALLIEGHLTDTNRIFVATGQALAERVRGSVFWLSYDLLSPLSRIAEKLTDKTPLPGPHRELPLFFSWERDDRQTRFHSEVTPEDGVNPQAALIVDVYTVGLNYKPHEQVAIKVDFGYEENGLKEIERVIETSLNFVF